MKILISDIEYIENSIENINLFTKINNFVREGNIIILDTNKPISFVADYLSNYNLDVRFYICNDGAVIFDEYFNVLYRKDINENVVRPIFNTLCSDNNLLEVFIDTSHGFVREYMGCANGIVASPIDRLKAEMTLNNICINYPSVSGYVTDNWLNIYDKNVNKYEALKYLLNSYNLSSSTIFSLGYRITDLEIIKNTNGYVLPNCFEDLKNISKGEVNNLDELITIIEK